MKHDLPKRQISLNLIDDVTHMAKSLLPDEKGIDLGVTKAAQALFVGFTLYQIDTLHRPDYSFGNTLAFIDVGDHYRMADFIPRMLKNKIHVQFSLPTDIAEDVLYLTYDESIDAICYAVMKSGRCTRGIIADNVYDHFKQKLKKTGKLALSEVNFFIEKIINPRRHLKRTIEVIDPLCRRSLEYFLTLDPQTQANATKRLMTLMHPFGDAVLEGEKEEGFYHVGPFWQNEAFIEERLFIFSHWKKYFCARQLMTGEAENDYNGELYQQRMEEDRERSGC